MTISARDQLIAFVALIVAILLLGLAPIVVSGILGKNLPDSLIAVSDKTVTGLVGVLGTIAAMIFRSNRADELKAENTGRALDTIGAAIQANPPGPQEVIVKNKPDEAVPVEEAS